MGKGNAWGWGLLLSVLLGVAGAHDFGGQTEPGSSPPPTPDPPCPAGTCCRGGGGNGGGPGFGGSGVGDPVWTFDGSLHLRYTDLEIGAVFPIRLVRSYDSRSAFDNSLGYGWAFEHDRRLFEYPDGSVIIRSGCGRRDRFVNTGGAYVTPRDGLQGALTELPDGTYEYRYADGKRDLFDADGKLAAIVNKAGQRQELLYDTRGRLPLVGTSPRAVDPNKPMVVAYQPQLIRIQERSATGVLTGYTVDFQYNATTGRLTRIIASDGRQIDYGHDVTVGATRGNLMTVAGAEYAQGFAYTDPLDTHNLTSIVDGTGAAAVVNTYNSKDQVTRQVHGGSTLELAYLSPGNTQVTEIVTDAAGTELQRRISTREFDESGYLTKETNPAGHEQRYYYNASKDRTRTELWEKQGGILVLLKTINNTYNGQAQKLTESITLDSSETITTTWTYDQGWIASEQTVSSADPQLFRTEYTFVRDAQGVPINIAAVKRRKDDGSFAVTTYTYCSAAEAAVPDSSCPDTKLVKQVDGPRTDVADLTTQTYYGTTDTSGCGQPTGPCQHRGDLRRVTNALGHGTDYLRYDAAGRATRISDANGILTELTYSPRGRLLERAVRGNAVTTDDAITTYAYDPRGNLTRQTQPDASYLDFVYDSRNRLQTIRDQAGAEVRYTLDSASNRLKEQTYDAGNVLRRTLTQTFDVLNRPLTRVGARSQTTQFTHDGAGRQTLVIDPRLVQAAQTYDDLDRLVTNVADAATGGIRATTQFTYDAAGNLRRVIDPKGLATTYQYNALSQLTQLVSPDTGTITYTYDDAGNRRTQLDARGITATYTYDVLNRLASIAYSNGSPGVAYAYDTGNLTACGATYPKGRLGTMTDASGSTVYCYDSFGHLVRKLQTTNGKAFTVNSTYTLAGRLASLTYPSGARVDYARNAQGQPSGVTYTPSGGAAQTLLSNVTYHPFGPPSELVYGDGRRLKRTLNQDYEPYAIEDTASGGLSLGYEFDPAGNLLKLRKGNQAEPPTRTYGHDALNRLAEVRDGSSTALLQGYGYDPTGNRTSSATIGITTTTTTTAYTYPTTSHRLSATGGTNTRSYDAAGNTTYIKASNKTYLFDAANRMSQVKTGTTVSMNYAYNGRGEQVRRYPTATSTAQTYAVYGEAGQVLGTYSSTAARLQEFFWLDDLPVGVIAGNALLHVQADHLGTPRAIIDPARQKAVWSWELSGEAFGTTVPNQDPDGDATSLVFDLRFPGQRYDAASGFNYNYFRDYEPGTGRYSQSDPAGLFGDIATYSYSSNKPLTHFDPNGLEPIYIGCAGGNGIVVCDGNGGFEARVCNTGCTAGCTEIHENQHVADLIRRAPNRCKGKRKGANPLVKADYLKPFFKFEIECRAYAASKKCFEKMRQRQSCPTPACEKDLAVYEAQANRMMRDYRCKEYGW